MNTVWTQFCTPNGQEFAQPPDAALLITSDLAAFMVALKMMESDGDYQSVNSLNFLGAYQFGEAALTDLGFDGDAYDNNYGGGWTGKYGIKSAKQFLNSERAQDKAMEEWLDVMWGYISCTTLTATPGARLGAIS